MTGKRKKNDFVQLCLYIDDLIVLHGGTLFVVTFADAKVVKHVEPVIRDRTIVKMKKCIS